MTAAVATQTMSHVPVIRMKNGEMHGFINVFPNYVTDDGFAKMKPENKKEAEAMRKEDSKLVKARYFNHRGAHERLSKPYSRWQGDPIQMWHFIPNEVYDIPQGLLNEVNTSGLIKRSKEDGPNNGVGIIEGKDKIHEFFPVGF